MKFMGAKEEINIKTKNPEFIDWKWIEISELSDVAVPFKINIYKKIVKKLKTSNLT